MNWRLKMAINSQEFKTLTIGNQSFDIAGENLNQQYPALCSYLDAPEIRPNPIKTKKISPKYLFSYHHSYYTPY